MAAVRKAEQRDLDFLLTYDRHIAPQELQLSPWEGMLVLEAESGIIGWLRWNLFWDNTPFMTMLYLLEGARGQGYGRRMVSQWEALMKAQGYSLVMTSIQSDETAQHFYRKLCYVDSGALLLPEEPLEIIFTKKLLSF